MNRLPSSWHTDRLHVADGAVEDVLQLMHIFNACSPVGKWDPTFKIYPEEEFSGLVAKSMADGVGNGRFQLQTIRHNHQPVGYFHCYHHHPHPNILLVSMFVFHPDHQKGGYGTELVAGLAQQARTASHQAIWLEVFLKNWPALRFWIKSGFTTIIDMDGAPQHDATAHASIVVAKSL
ncbi:MAG: GNAT family N-acetyltransferase [Anaerolineaceae bacterium]|nr:GNAT family N-acetyltransferase [Anaerolineaceae bacterium]